MTLEKSNLVSGVRCSLVLYFIMLWLSLQCVRTTTNHRLKRLTEEDVCKETNKTIEPLQNFPVSYTILQERMQQKKCDNLPKCNGEDLVYHCVRYNHDLVEVCAPRRLITGSYCAVFDIGIGRVIEDFSRPCSECPFKYPSADAMNYSSCMKKEKMQISSPTSNKTSSTGTKKIIGTTGSPCCDGSRCKRTAKGCAKNKSTSLVVITNENHPTREEEIEQKKRGGKRTNWLHLIGRQKDYQRHNQTFDMHCRNRISKLCLILIEDRFLGLNNMNIKFQFHVILFNFVHAFSKQTLKEV